MEKLNPWTGKQKAKSDGKFYAILADHYPHLDHLNKLEMKYKKLSTLIQAPQPQPTLDEYSSLICIQKKHQKLDKILQWLSKYEQQLQFPLESIQTSTPIDSSYVYLPIYSGNILNELLKQSQNNSMHYEGIMPDRVMNKIQKDLKEIKEILKINQKLVTNIIL